MMRRTSTSVGLALLAAVLVAVLALALRSPGAPAAASAAGSGAVQHGHVTIKIMNFAFVPSHVTVAAGTKITFINEDSTAHTATAADHSFDTGTIQPQHSATITVHASGTHPYICLFHAFMNGTVKVIR